jgi:TetR/AcrR family transcriptional regulator, cholesterol catabolism regulator
VSLSGLYYYFQSKEELLFLIQDHAFGTLIQNLEELLEGVDDPHRRIRLLIENHLRFFVNNMAEMKVLSHEADSLSGEFRARVNAKKRGSRDRDGDPLRSSNRRPDLDVRVATFALFGMMNWLYNWYRPERDVPVEQLVEQMKPALPGRIPGAERWRPSCRRAGGRAGRESSVHLAAGLDGELKNNESTEDHNNRSGAADDGLTSRRSCSTRRATESRSSHSTTRRRTPTRTR